MNRTRHECTAGARCEIETLREAIFCALHHSETPLKVIAERLNVRYGYLIEASNPDRDDTQFQARLIVPLALATGNFSILECLAQQAGGCFFVLPDLGVRTRTALTAEQLGRAMQEFGTFVAQSADALNDAVISPEEARALMKQADCAVATLARSRAILERLTRPASQGWVTR